ncbi:MAG: hypothetical protein PF542_04760 [Nanoarchaeota archaeon]|jgi:hypothetical protein|nr:hypothetical protein [Nanoarchaeota archaeon]
MKKWLIITLSIIAIAAILFFTTGSMTGKTVYETEGPTTIDGIVADHVCDGGADGGCTGTHEVEESCDNLDCPKRGTELCNEGF